jgi:hypothetical protein
MASVIGVLLVMSLSISAPLSLDAVLARAGIAAAAFHRDVPQLVADESYVQVFAPTPGSPSITRSIRSEFAMAADEDRATWYGFRHVLEVDGRPLPDAARGRLEHVLLGPRPASLIDARRIAMEGAPYVQLGFLRGANTPTFALTVLLPAQQPRFAFSRRGEKRVRNLTVWVVGYREIRGPMFFSDVEGREVPMTGEFWIDPRSGAVFRSTFVVDSGEAVEGETGRSAGPLPLANVGCSRMTIEVTYKADPALGVTVPVEMEETFSGEVRTGGGGLALGDTGATHYLRQRLSCVARYTNHRRVVAHE